MKKYIYFLIMIISSCVIVKAENEATIKDVKVNGIECQCSGYECSVEVDASSATITYQLNDSDATVDRLSGFKIDLLSQVTTVKIKVSNTLNGEKVENTYNVNITKHEKKNDFSLKTLTVNGEKINVVDSIVVYSYTSLYDAEKIVIEATTNDSNAKVIKENEYPFALTESSLAVDFYVQAENGEKETYRIVVTRGVKPNTTLKSIKVDHGKIDFDENTFEYKFNVEYGINEIQVEAIPKNGDAKVEIINNPLVVGENEIKITVTNGKNKSEYLLLVTREENIDKSVANLKKLNIREYPKLDFNENVLDYTLFFNKIPEKLNIEALAKNSDSQVDILENEGLKDGSTVIVRVTLELEENTITRDYTLKLKTQKEMHDNKTVILICIICLTITIIILGILEIHSKRCEKRKYLKKILELRHKKESRRKEEKKKKVKEEEIEII